MFVSSSLIFTAGGPSTEDAPSSTAATVMSTDKLKAAPSSIDEKRKSLRADTNAKLAAMFGSAPTISNNEDVDTTASPSPLTDIGANFTPCTLPDILNRLHSLMDALPKEIPAVPDELSGDNGDTTAQHAIIKSFASSLQIVIEQYNLLLSLVSSATYKWGVDRSGASQQNLSVMASELAQCQEMISGTVSGRLSNVLCPAVDVLVGEVEIVRDNNVINTGDDESGGRKKRRLNTTSDSKLNQTNERRINHYIRAQVDPAYVHLSHVILARNGEMIRHTVATSIYTAQKVIRDYLNAMKKDEGHNGFNL